MTSRPRITDARACVWSDDGALLAVATDDGVALWHLGGELSLTRPGPNEPIDALALDGTKLWAAGAEQLHCLDITTGAVLQSWPIPGRVLALSITARVWIGSAGSTLTIGEGDTGATRPLRRPDLRVPDEDDNIWEAYELEEQRAVCCVAVAPDGARMIAAYLDGACWMFDLRGDHHHALRSAGEPLVTAIAWSRGGDVFVLAGTGRFTLHDGRTCKPHHHSAQATRLFEDVTAVAFASGASELAITSEYQAEDGTVEDLEFIRVDTIDERKHRTHIQIRDIPTRRHIPSARAAAHDPAGRVLAICTQYRGVSLWDSEARGYLGTLQVFAGCTAGLLAHEPRTVGEQGRIELVGDTAQLAGLGADLYHPWTKACLVSSGRGAVTQALLDRLRTHPRRRRTTKRSL